MLLGLICLWTSPSRLIHNKTNCYVSFLIVVLHSRIPIHPKTEGKALAAVPALALVPALYPGKGIPLLCSVALPGGCFCRIRSYPYPVYRNKRCSLRCCFQI